jgi:hypothetical protein
VNPTIDPLTVVDHLRTSIQQLADHIAPLTLYDPLACRVDFNLLTHNLEVIAAAWQHLHQGHYEVAHNLLLTIVW